MFLKRIRTLFKKEKTTTDFSPIDQVRYPMQKVRFAVEHVSRRPNRISLKTMTHDSKTPVDVAFVEGLTRFQVKLLIDSYPL